VREREKRKVPFNKKRKHY